MSTFRGCIEELPGISVDRFQAANRNSSTVYFLSHFHTDHIEGLDYSGTFFQQIADKNQYIYCTALTKTFLMTKFRLNSGIKCIKEISVCNPIVITYKDPNVNESESSGESSDLLVTVTAVPAGHCPGSIMFLFEAHRNDKDLTILCTGDFRIHPSDFSKLKPLHIKINDKLVPKKFDNVYLDTTFYNEKFSKLPSRQQALDEIVPVVKDWLGQNDNKLIIIEISANYGSEDLFTKLSAAVNERIHVRDIVKQNYRYIPELSQYTTENPSDARIHACMPKNKRFRATKDALTCRPEVEGENILTIIPSVWRWMDKDLSHGFTELNWAERRFYVCYSCHASYEELKAFIDYFKPMKLHPCVVPNVKTEHAWREESQMKFKEFQRKIHDAHGLSKPIEITEGFDCDFMEYKSLKRPRARTDESDDDF